MGQAVIITAITAVITYLMTGVSYRRTSQAADDPGELLFARVGEHRSVEIWLRGMAIDIRVIDIIKE